MIRQAAQCLARSAQPVLGFVAMILVGFLASVAVAQPKGPGAEVPNKRAAQEQRRNWVRSQIPKLVADERQRAEILARLNHLADDQVQELATLCLDELEARRKQQFAALREANSRERAFQEQIARQAARQIPPQPVFLAPPVGFIPVITWLPEGASLSAQAVVSPDGRHVRMSVVPFFSTIGPVYTFNFMTGETRRHDP